MIFIKFLYFWPRFDINNNFITRIFNNNNIAYTVSDEYIQDDNILKFVFIGSFIISDEDIIKIQNIPLEYIKILYLSEPIEHFYKCYNLFISNNFDYVFGSINNDLTKNYYKFPYYLLYYFYKGNRNKLDEYNYTDLLYYDNTYATFYKEVNDSVQFSTHDILSKQKFCLINSHDIYNIRTIIYNKINEKFGNIITCPGFLYNNTDNNELNTIGKIEYLKKFIFNICPENCITSIKGYITEKLLESSRSGCIPIYYGSFDDIDAQIFNKDRIIFYDTMDENSMNECINKISFLLYNPDKLEEMYKLPIFLETAHNTILNLEKNFCNIFSNNSYNKMMANKLTYNHTIIDLILYNRYFKNVMNGVCIDIGAGNGSTNNYSYYFNKRLNWNCINIEPLSNMHNQLCSNRYNKGNVNLKIGISNKNTIIPIKNYFHPKLNYESGLATLTYNKDQERYLIKLCTNQFTIEQIETKTYKQLVDIELSLNKVDLLIINVNNHMLEILEGMIGTVFLPSVIVVIINKYNKIDDVTTMVMNVCNKYRLDYIHDNFLFYILPQINVNITNVNYIDNFKRYRTISPALGIGDLLTLKMYEMSNNITFNDFIINVYIIKFYKINADNNIIFITNLINNLFNNPKITYIYEKNIKIDRYYENINTFYLYDYYNFSINNESIVDKVGTNKKYIIFHCKIRFDYCRDNFNNEISILDKFIDEFKTDYDIVLFGERILEQNLEVKTHKMISIYQNLIKLKNNNNVIDLTRDGLCSDNSIESYEIDAKIISNAVLNIIIGYGGPLAISMAYCKNNVYYINNLKHLVFDSYIKINNNMFRDINKFFNYINEKVGIDNDIDNNNIVNNNIVNNNIVNNDAGKMCIFTFHLSTGDNFTMYASVCHYAKLYKKVIVYALFRNRYTVTQLYEKINNIKVVIIKDQHYNDCIVPEIYIKKCYDYYCNRNGIIGIDIIKCGSNVPDFSGYYFWKVFYKQIGLDYNIRYENDYRMLNRNYERETILYNKVIERYGDKYIFVHDHRFLDKLFRNSRHTVILPDIDIPIFHPNCNYYEVADKNNKFINLWYNFISDNLLDYCMIIEKAYAIHINDSSFSCICPYLNLSHIQDKTMYTTLDVIDYDNSFNEWTIIKTG
jgi:alpha(1,3/1,4) fucosyltransferase